MVGRIHLDVDNRLVRVVRAADADTDQQQRDHQHDGPRGSHTTLL